MLISIDRLEAELGTLDTTQAAFAVEKASALVVDYVADSDITDEWGEDTTPASVQGVVVEMIRRGLQNPLGLTGENLGDHGWTSNPRTGVGPYLAPSEEKIIDRAIGRHRGLWVQPVTRGPVETLSSTRHPGTLDDILP